MTPKRTPARFGLQNKPPSQIPVDSFPFWTWTTPAQANHPNFQLPVVPPSMATINCSSCTHHQSENLYKAQDSRTSRVHQNASLHLLSADCCFHNTFKDERTVFFCFFFCIFSNSVWSLLKQSVFTDVSIMTLPALEIIFYALLHFLHPGKTENLNSMLLVFVSLRPTSSCTVVA